MYLTQSS